MPLLHLPAVFRNRLLILPLKKTWVSPVAKFRTYLQVANSLKSLLSLRNGIYISRYCTRGLWSEIPGLIFFHLVITRQEDYLLLNLWIYLAKLLTIKWTLNFEHDNSNVSHIRLMLKKSLHKSCLEDVIWYFFFLWYTKFPRCNFN